jgi:hypothetical protein
MLFIVTLRKSENEPTEVQYLALLGEKKLDNNWSKPKEDLQL